MSLYSVGSQENLANVTPSDSTDLGSPCNLIFCGGAGTLKVTTVGGQSITITGVTAGQILPIRATRIWSTGTSATNIAALW
jgi:hypothetical protein